MNRTELIFSALWRNIFDNHNKGTNENYSVTVCVRVLCCLCTLTQT